MPPDEVYCWQALEKTGIYMIPGHVFDMKGSAPLNLEKPLSPTSKIQRSAHSRGDGGLVESLQLE